MSADEHNKIVGIGFGIFAMIYAFTFLLLMLVSAGVFVALGADLAKETADSNERMIGALGGIFAVVFYGVLGLIFVLPLTVASLKMLRRRPHARVWGVIAAIPLIPIMPLGTILGIYGLWFLLGSGGSNFYSRV